MRRFVRQSAQVRAFLEVCAKSKLKLREDDAERLFDNWCRDKDLVSKEYRALRNCFNKKDYRTTKYHHRFNEFSKEVLDEDFPENYFNISTHMRYYFGEFAEQNIAWSSLLDSCVGEYEVIRLGFYDIEKKGKGEADADPKLTDRYHLKISRPGDGGLYEFQYSPLSVSSVANNSIWEGYAVAAQGYIFLTGVALHEGHDAALFALRRHDEPNSKILVGAQFALMTDDPEHCAAQKGGRDLAVVRRIAAFPNHKRDYRKLRSAAEAWVLQEPWGAVVPIHFTPTPRVG